MNLVKIRDNVFEFPLNKIGYEDAIKRAMAEKNYEMALRLSHSFYAHFVKQLPPALRFSNSSRRLRFDYYSLLADIYQDTNLFKLANNMYYRMLLIGSTLPVNKRKLNNALWMLGKNHFILGNSQASVLYIEKYFQSDLPRDEFYADMDWGLEMAEVLEDEFSVPDIRIVYPLSAVDYSKEIEAAKECIAEGDVKSAIRILGAIPAENKLYFKAQNELSSAYYLNGQPTKAISLALKNYERNNTDVRTLCNLVTFYAVIEDTTNAKRFANKLLALDVQNAALNKEIIMAISHLGLHHKMIERLELVLKASPYDINMLLMCSIAYNNIGDFESSDRLVSKALLIDKGNYLGKYIKQVIANNLTKSNDKIQRLEYSSEPLHEQERRAKEVRKLLGLSQDEFDKIVAYEANELDYLSWVFRSDNKGLQLACVDKLLNSSNVYSIDFTKELLLVDLHKDVSKRIVYNFVLEHRVDKFFVVDDNLLKELAIVFPTDYLDLPLMLRQAYAITYSTVAFILNDFEYDLFKAIGRVAKKLEDKSLKQYRPEAIAACILYLTNHPVVKNIKANTQLFYDLFTVGKQEFFECLEYINSPSVREV